MEQALLSSIERRKKYSRKIFSLSVLLYLITPALVLLLAFNSVVVEANEGLVEVEHTHLSENSLLDPSIHVVGCTHPFSPNLVKITYKGESIKVLTSLSNVSEILDQNSISYDSDDIVNPGVDSYIANNAAIKVVSVDNETEIVELELPFEIIYEEDPELDFGQERLVETGVMGTMVQSYAITYEDGELVSRELESEITAVEPIDEVVVRGTKRAYYTSASCSYWDGVIDETTADESARDWLKYIMRCESKCNSEIVSSNGIWHGLFQYLPATFRAYGGTDIYDGSQQIPMALNTFLAGETVQVLQFGHCAKSYLATN